MVIARLIAKIGADDSEFHLKMGQASSRLKKFSGEAQGVGTALSLGLTAPLAAIGVKAVKTAADFEQSLNILQYTTQATGQQMKDIAKLAVDLGNDMTLPATSAKDAAEAMLEMSKAGLSVKDTMDAARGVLQLSAAALVWDGIQDIVGGALRAVGNLLTAAVKTFYNVGQDIIRGLVNGIKSGISWVTDAAKGVAQSALDAAKGVLGIRSPSKAFQDVGQNVAQGLANGMTDNADLVSAAAKVLSSAAHDPVYREAKALKDTIGQIADDFQDVFMNAFDDLFQRGFSGFFSSVLGGFRNLLQKMASEYLSSVIIRALGGFVGNVIGGKAGADISKFFGGSFGGFRAGGGSVEAGRSYVVGEEGPELVTFGGSGYVTPHPALAGGGNITVNMTIQTPDVAGFQQSEGQILSRLQKQLAHWNRRQG